MSGVASQQWDNVQFRARARASIEEHGGIDDQPAFDQFLGRLQYIDGDYNDASTFATRKFFSARISPTRRKISRLLIPRIVSSVFGK